MSRARASSSFFAVVLMGYTFPAEVNDRSRTQLEAENRELKLEASNAAIGIQKIDAKVSELEEISKRINELVVKK